MNKPDALSVTDRLRGYMKRIAEAYPDCWRQMDRFRSMKGSERVPVWPEWCWLPLSASITIDGMYPPSGKQGMRGDIAALATLGAWRPGQGVYHFDPTILEEIWQTKLTGDIPSDILHMLPEWCVYIPFLPARGGNAGFFAYIDAEDEKESLRLTLDQPPYLASMLPIHLGAGGILAGIEHAKSEALKLAQGADVEVIQQIDPKEYAERLAPLVACVLYLCTANRDLRDSAGQRSEPSRPKPIKVKGEERYFPPDQPTTWQVGYRIGAALRRAVDESNQGGDEHASPRAHIRRAHWHTFLAGPKAEVQRERRLKWLPPIPVNIEDGLGDDLPIVPTIRAVAYDPVWAGLTGLQVPEAREYLCHACAHRWNRQHPRKPDRCPTCKSNEWDYINCPPCGRLMPEAHVLSHLKSLNGQIVQPEGKGRQRAYLIYEGGAGEYLLCPKCGNWLSEAEFRWQKKVMVSSSRGTVCRRCEAKTRR